MTALICMACSQVKRPDQAAMPAIERYDGPLWQTLRMALRDLPERPAIWVLSARFGFFPASTNILNYEQFLTPSLAEKIARLPQYEPQIFANAVEGADRVLFAGGQLYRATMFRAARPRVDIAETDGKGIGYQRQQLREWIENL
jgi:hypothetical protein